jgi:hypothetical protein
LFYDLLLSFFSVPIFFLLFQFCFVSFSLVFFILCLISLFYRRYFF